MNNRSLKIRDPFREIRDLERRIWQDFFAPSDWTMLPQSFHPLSELTEDESNYYLHTELPGLTKENIKIEADEKSLKIYGERKEQAKKTDARQHYSEFSYGSFSRVYNFPSVIDREKIQANYQSGILNLTVPKSGQSKLKKIEIK